MAFGCEQNSAQNRSLISYSEVLDPASKAAVLTLDSQVQMRGMINAEVQVREAFDSCRVPSFSREVSLSNFLPITWWPFF